MYKELYQHKERIFIPFFMIGDPDYHTSLQLIRNAIDDGIDAIELGIPYTDPIADGPIIQAANIRGFKAGINLQKVLQFIQEIREYAPQLPIGLLTYYNLLFSNNPDILVPKLAAAGTSSIVLGDLPPENAGEIAPLCREHAIDTVFLLSANTAQDRLPHFHTYASGFLYLVSLYGVTGVRTQMNTALKDTITFFKDNMQLPICVGFGISTPEHAIEVYKAGAWGAIVGSAIVKRIADNLSDTSAMEKQVRTFIQTMIASKAYD